MSFFVPGNLLGSLNPLFLEPSIALYKELTDLNSKNHHFIKKDFYSSLLNNQPISNLHLDPKNLEKFIPFERSYWNFCRNIQLGKIESNIPKILHFIWLGSSLPIDAKLSIDSWKRHHPNWDIKVWQDPDIANFNWAFLSAKESFFQAKTYSEKADILRYNILYNFGGVYSDTDVVCIKPFDCLTDSGCDLFSGFQINSFLFHIAVGIIGAKKNHPLLKECLEAISSDPNLHLFDRTGPALFTKKCLSCFSENLLILPTSYFYPLPSTEKNRTLDEVIPFVSKESMAIHLWQASWK
jgi:mannosyltransferase OCH1-like enzyme